MAFSGLTNGVLTLDAGASNTTMNYNRNGTTIFAEGVDVADADKWKLSYGGVLGVNDYFTINTNEQRQLPLQPAFMVSSLFFSISSAIHGGGDRVQSVSEGVIQYDIQSNITLGSYAGGTATRFTAPASGLYYFTASLPGRLQWGGDPNSSPGRNTWLNIVTTSRTYEAWRFINDAVDFLSGKGTGPGIFVFQAISGSAFVPLTAGDIAYLQIGISESPTAGANGGSWSCLNTGFFSGYLVE